MPDRHAPIADSILRLPAVIERTGLSRASIYRLMGIGLFPKKHPLAMRAVGWKRSEIDHWINTRMVT
ncbi:AlpA family phage regulatory protein [Sphingomonas sp.]|uniref:AlpA family phage regulatory protein n=1 Tax=Sphingomonas sp. TaxID=28214 RepID=UPI002ED80CFB